MIAYRITVPDGPRREDGVLVRWFDRPDVKDEHGGALAFVYRSTVGAAFQGDIAHEWGRHVEGSTQIEAEQAVEAILAEEGWTIDGRADA